MAFIFNAGRLNYQEHKRFRIRRRVRPEPLLVSQPAGITQSRQNTYVPKAIREQDSLAEITDTLGNRQIRGLCFRHASFAVVVAISRGCFRRVSHRSHPVQGVDLGEKFRSIRGDRQTRFRKPSRLYALHTVRRRVPGRFRVRHALVTIRCGRRDCGETAGAADSEKECWKCDENRQGW